MKKILLVSLLFTSFSAMATSDVVVIKDCFPAKPVIKEKFIKEKGTFCSTKNQISPINYSNSPSFKVSFTLYKENNNTKKEVIYELVSSTLNQQKVVFGNTKTISYTSEINVENTTLNSENKNEKYVKRELITTISPEQLITGFEGFIIPVSDGNNMSIQLCFSDTELINLKDLTINDNTIELPTTNLYSFIQNRKIKLNSPIIINLKDDMKMSLVVNQI